MSQEQELVIYCVAAYFPSDETSNAVYQPLLKEIMSQHLNLACYRLVDLDENDRIQSWNIIVVGMMPTKDIHNLIVGFLMKGKGTRYKPHDQQIIMLFKRWIEGRGQGRRFLHYPNLSGPRITSFD